MVLSKSQPWPWFTPYHVKSLKKRLDWIAQCGAISAGMLHHLTNKKTNTSLYYFEAQFAYRAVRAPWGWATISTLMDRPSCYYLGKFPNHWNATQRRITFAHDLGSSDSYSMGSKPEIPGVFLATEEQNALDAVINTYSPTEMNTYFGKEILTPEAHAAFWDEKTGKGPKIKKEIEDASFFQTTEDKEAYIGQGVDLRRLKQEFDECYNKNFPKPEKNYTPRAREQSTFEPFTKTPIPQMELPKPTPSSQAPAGAGEKKLNLYLNFFQSETTKENALEALFTIEIQKD